MKKKYLYSSILAVIIITIFLNYDYFIKDKDNNLVQEIEAKNESMAVYLDGEHVSTFPSKTSGYKFDKIVCDNGEIGTFNSISWTFSVSNIVSNTRCNIYFTVSSNDEILAIDLEEGMIPVAFDEAGNTIKASGDASDNNWYNYDEYRWANALLVKETSRSSYVNAVVGTQINAADILAYFVWIPRYKYQLWNVNEDGATYSVPQLIEIELQTIDSDKENGIQNGQWLTHPAFTFGGTELNGFWIGKFELTGDTETPTILPNVTSLRTQIISSFFTTTTKFKTNSIYGISATGLDAHMIKNIEWGAVAYLSQSKYGQYNQTGAEILINPSEGYITGRGGVTSSQATTTDNIGNPVADLYSWNGYKCSLKSGYVCTGLKQEVYGMASSTTGNIYGVYDMNGGAYEFVMANEASNADNFANHIMYTRNAGTTFGVYTDITLPKKYFDIYKYGSSSTGVVAYTRGNLGDATREIVATSSRGWDGDSANFFYSIYSWLRRGGSHSAGSSSGIWNFINANGSGGDDFSTRAIVSRS